MVCPSFTQRLMQVARRRLRRTTTRHPYRKQRNEETRALLHLIDQQARTITVLRLERRLALTGRITGGRS